MCFPSGFNLDEDGFPYLSSGDFATVKRIHDDGEIPPFALIHTTQGLLAFDRCTGQQPGTNPHARVGHNEG
jgi:hypothetical protein